MEGKETELVPLPNYLLTFSDTPKLNPGHRMDGKETRILPRCPATFPTQERWGKLGDTLEALLRHLLVLLPDHLVILGEDGAVVVGLGVQTRGHQLLHLGLDAPEGRRKVGSLCWRYPELPCLNYGGVHACCFYYYLHHYWGSRKGISVGKLCNADSAGVALTCLP